MEDQKQKPQQKQNQKQKKPSKPTESKQEQQKKQQEKTKFVPKTFNVPFIDTHVHLDMTLENRNMKPTDLQTLVDAEFSPDFNGCVNVCCFVQSYDACESIQNEALKNPSNRIFSSYGMHPHDAKFYNQDIENRILENMKKSSTVAWGECGLDYFKNISEPDVQKQAFRRQLEMALKVQKPVIVHSRDAEDDTWSIMSEVLPKDYPIHLHCFTGTPEFATKMLDHFENLCIGFTGSITFKSAAKNRDAVKVVPLDRILLETDGPFMAPEPYRGIPAHPGMIPLVAEMVASLKGVTVEETLKQTTINANKVYKCFS